MHVDNVKTNVHRWGALALASVMLAGLLLLLPKPAQAATTIWGPWHFFGRDQVVPGFWVTGEVTGVEDGSVTVELPNHRHARGMMSHISLQVSLDVVSDTVLLDGELAPLELSTLEEGDEVVVVPGLVWGNLVARLLYVGDPEELADASYTGQLVKADGDTLTLESGREGEFTVVVDDDTIWYDNGQMERPADLPEEIGLRVLGIEDENEEGDDVIHAVLITPER